MGLGKTLMTLALCIANPPPRDEKRRATLIVCTPALLVQCMFSIAIIINDVVLPGLGYREIQMHTQTDHFLVLRHYSSEKVAGTPKTIINIMQSQDIM